MVKRHGFSAELYSKASATGRQIFSSSRHLGSPSPRGFLACPDSHYFYAAFTPDRFGRIPNGHAGNLGSEDLAADHLLQAL